MRRMRFTGMIACVGALALLVCLSSVASAATVKLHSSGHRTGTGGEFAVEDEGPGLIDLDTNLASTVMQHQNSNKAFLSFCLEKSEQFHWNTSYTYSINKHARGGGLGATAGKDYLSAATAKLFFTYWCGGLGGFNYGDNGSARASDGEQLQIALWYLEEEVDQAELDLAANSKAKGWVDWVSGKTWAQIDSALDSAVGSGDYCNDWLNLGRVRVLNLYEGVDNDKQSQLIVMGTSTSSTEAIPLPPAALMGIGLLGALGLVRRVRRRR